MKNAFVFILLTCSNLPAYSQVIKGTIFDNTTKEPVIAASIFFSGTSFGVLSDDKGNFILDISKYPTLPLTISAIGYYSITLVMYSKEKPIIVYLNPKTFELNEVVVKEKSQWSKRKANLIIFRREFLGTTVNSLNCNIENEKDLRFKTSANKDTLIAYSLNPILIDNKALGYKITYFLDKFEYCKSNRSFLFEGKVLFKEDSTALSTKKAYYERRRKTTYLGSRMHFLRSLWHDNLNPAGFTVMISDNNESINYKKIVVDMGNNQKYLQYPGGFGISYYTNIPTTFVHFLKDRIYFDAVGYHETGGIIWEGEMARQRIADLLPYDYNLPDIK